MFVSIHAPYAGSDRDGMKAVLSLKMFQSTPPMQGATALRKLTIFILKVSIHAPYAGSDYIQQSPLLS